MWLLIEGQEEDGLGCSEHRENGLGSAEHVGLPRDDGIRTKALLLPPTLFPEEPNLLGC